MSFRQSCRLGEGSSSRAADLQELLDALGLWRLAVLAHSGIACIHVLQALHGPAGGVRAWACCCTSSGPATPRLQISGIDLGLVVTACAIPLMLAGVSDGGSNSAQLLLACQLLLESSSAQPCCAADSTESMPVLSEHMP